MKSFSFDERSKSFQINPDCAMCGDKYWINIVGIPDVDGGCCPKCNADGKIPLMHDPKELITLQATLIDIPGICGGPGGGA